VGNFTTKRTLSARAGTSTQFRRVNGHLHLPALRTALEKHVAAETVGIDCNTQDERAA
jgi:hypothetical protein